MWAETWYLVPFVPGEGFSRVDRDQPAGQMRILIICYLKLARTLKFEFLWTKGRECATRWRAPAGQLRIVFSTKTCLLLKLKFEYLLPKGIQVSCSFNLCQTIKRGQFGFKILKSQNIMLFWKYWKISASKTALRKKFRWPQDNVSRPWCWHENLRN